MSALDYQFRRDIDEPDPDKKDKAWAARLIRQFRIWMEPMVERKRAEKNRSYLEGRQDMDRHRKKFVETSPLKWEYPFDFEPLGIMEKTVNILRAEREKAGLYIQLNSEDPTAQTEKEANRKILQNSEFIENQLSAAYMAMGFPPYKIAEDESLKGDKITGNLDSFKEMGLDPNSAEDIAYFFSVHFRLDVEIAAEAAVNNFIKEGELHTYIKRWTDDMIAVKAIASRVYCNEVTHKPQYEYLRAEDVSWIPGVREDGKDAMAIMHQQNMTVAQLIRKIGSELSPDLVQDVLAATNYTHATKYDGFYSKEHGDCGPCHNPIQRDAFMDLKIGVGYVEWKSPEAKTRKVGVNELGNFVYFDKGYEWEEKPDSNYKKENLWSIKTKKAYFIMKTTTEAAVFGLGDLYDMETEGEEDEYSNFSFQVYKEPGLSAIEVSIPFINVIHDAFFRYCWLINKAKPAGTRYNFTMIAAVASKLFQNDNKENQIKKTMKMFQDSVDDFFIVDSNNPNLQNQNPHYEKKNGVDPAVKDLWEAFMANQAQISEKLGINAIREAYSPSPNDGYKLQMETLQQSRNATDYISRAIMNKLSNMAKTTLSITQDMLELKGSKSYNAMEQSIGIKNINALRALKKVPLHKYGIYVESFNTDLQRQQFDQEAKEAYQLKEIPFHVYKMIVSIKNLKRAIQVLIYEKAKEMKNKQAEAAEQQQGEMQKLQFKHQADMELEGVKGKNAMDKQGLVNEGLIAVAKIDAGQRLELKNISNNAKKMEADVRADAEIRKDEAKAKIARGEPASLENI